MRPEIHFTPVRNWMNDPVGLIYYQGNYHLFYQYFPYEKKWGTMHWGHAVSRDLLRWRHLPVALYPSRLEDCNGCFSGSAVEDDGKMYLFYTGVRYDKVCRDNIHQSENELFTSCQMGIVSEDGLTFDSNGKKLLIPAFEDQKLGSRVHTRDPKVWKDSYGWHMVLGSQCEQEGELMGQLLFYESRNAETWSFQNRCLMPGEAMLECPDLFQEESSWILLASFMERGRGDEPAHISCGGIVEYNPKTGALKADVSRLIPLDAGMDLYAAQTMKDADGRNVMLAWIRMPESFEGEGWIGMLTLPRVISVKNGRLRYAVHPFVKEQFTISCRPEMFFHAAVQIQAELEEDGKIDIGGYLIERRGRLLRTDRKQVFPENAVRWLRETETELAGDRCHLEIYVDHGVVEIFANKGETVITQAVYGMQERFFCENVIALSCRRMEEQNLLQH